MFRKEVVHLGVTIDVNMDRKCKKCGREGAIQNGYCLNCNTEALLNKPFLLALSKIPETMENLIAQHQKDLEEAWSLVTDDMMTISFQAKVGITNGKKVGEVSISFTKEKVKDSAAFSWEDSKQLSLIKGT